MSESGGMRTETEWAALCCASETNQVHEARYVLWVIRNRVASSRYPDTFRDVVLQRYQFSFFNEFVPARGGLALPDETIFTKALAGYPGKTYPAMLPAATAILAEPAWDAPFGPDVLHYYSVVSMKPAGSKPAWAPSAKRLFTPSGVDPARFVFAAGVP